jgi:hypothetical protein
MSKKAKIARGPQQGAAPRVFSFGGGVQSMAALVLAAQGRIDYRWFVFADVGADSEYPATMTYLEAVAKPFAAAHGLRLVTTQRRRKDGSFESILEKLHRTQTSIDIPVRMANGAPGNRSCTADYKVKPVAAFMRGNGATIHNPGRVGIGISTDEITRMKPSQIEYIHNEHPLIDLELSRQDCLTVIAAAGLPLPPKSSCWFCPFHRPSAWLEMREHEPELFARSVELEAMINDRRAAMGKDQVWLTRFARPLDEAIELFATQVEGKRQDADARARRSQGAGRPLLPTGYEAMSLFDLDGAHSCGPFTCDGSGGSDDPSDPFAGLVVRKIA